MEQFDVFWPYVVLAAVAIAIILFLLLRPRQSVRLSDDQPKRPHMAAPSTGGGTAKKDIAHEGQGIGDEIAAAASDVAGDILEAPVHANLPGASGPPDDLQRLKGVGPKLAQMLNQRGVTRFEQLARLTPEEVDRLDDGMGAFRGRLKRDRVAEQADYLARGDTEGFEARFGKL
jgi:predicted flap endonuclease-1-like 5' DNA nuclease